MPEWPPGSVGFRVGNYALPLAYHFGLALNGLLLAASEQAMQPEQMECSLKYSDAHKRVSRN